MTFDEFLKELNVTYYGQPRAGVKVQQDKLLETDAIPLAAIVCGECNGRHVLLHLYNHRNGKHMEVLAHYESLSGLLERLGPRFSQVDVRTMVNADYIYRLTKQQDVMLTVTVTTERIVLTDTYRDDFYRKHPELDLRTKKEDDAGDALKEAA